MQVQGAAHSGAVDHKEDMDMGAAGDMGQGAGAEEDGSYQREVLGGSNVPHELDPDCESI